MVPPQPKTSSSMCGASTTMRPVGAVARAGSTSRRSSVSCRRSEFFTGSGTSRP